MVEIPASGMALDAYLALPGTHRAPGVIVIQEWWGLVPHIRTVCDRLAEEGFVALAPDLYRGAATTEPDEAHKLMMGLKVAQSASDLAAAAVEVAGVQVSYGHWANCAAGRLPPSRSLRGLGAGGRARHPTYRRPPATPECFLVDSSQTPV